MQTKWNSSEWSWQPGNFRNKLIWQGVFIMLQGTGWSDKNRSWQIDYLLENGTPRWCSEMWRGVWSGSRSWGWLVGKEWGDGALFGAELLSFLCFIKHCACLQLSLAVPVAVMWLCQCSSSFTFCNLFCSCLTQSWCLCASDLSSIHLLGFCCSSASFLSVVREGEEPWTFCPNCPTVVAFAGAIFFYTCKASKCLVPGEKKMSITWYISL